MLRTVVGPKENFALTFIMTLHPCNENRRDITVECGQGSYYVRLATLSVAVEMRYRCDLVQEWMSGEFAAVISSCALSRLSFDCCQRCVFPWAHRYKIELP
ncbi:hypothetical protein J6590_081705 [Homalodisca vitripennis]|nr:hypothetical protein J6590_081705 [Homalodisca vitripennis]